MEATATISEPDRKPNPAKPLLRALAPVLLDPAAHGHPGIAPVARFVIEFDGYKGLTDLIGGDLYLAMSIDRCPLLSDQAEALLATRVPDHRHGRTKAGELLDQAIEVHLQHIHHRHPNWNDEEGAHGHLDIRFLPRLRISGRITRRFVASRTSRL